MAASYPVAAFDTSLGATVVGDEQVRFVVWAPYAETAAVHFFGSDERVVPLQRARDGYFVATIEGIKVGSRYKYRLNRDRELPDPVSGLQPEGVHGPSEIIRREFQWSDHGWRGMPLADYIFYELHVGTFTGPGTFDSAIEQLEYLADLGVTAVELMPVAQFPGARNWGYDGVYPFAVQNSYGGPNGLKRFVNAAHQKGLAVVLDVVYNHLGPEGNYLNAFGPYFTDRYETPWGLAVNYDRSDSAGVRRFVIENALRWVTEFHIDALRLDAVHAIFDESPRHILQEIAEAVHGRSAELGRHVHVIAESDLNEPRLVEPAAEGGYGLDAHWSDDFHHALHALLTKERGGYYRDFDGIHHVAKALGEGFVYSGQYSAYRARNHGTSSRHIPATRFVVCSQNHDQVGNRMLGERLSTLLDFEQLKLAAGVVLLSPFLPLLFMGQEYGEPAPFLYFVNHSDPRLIEAVREGRRREFAAFAWRGDVPDAQAIETFARSRLNHTLRQSGRHQILLDFYKELIRLRKSAPALKNLSMQSSEISISANDALLVMRRRAGDDCIAVLFNFGECKSSVALTDEPGRWGKLLDSSDSRWMGAGGGLAVEESSDGTGAVTLNPKSVCLLEQVGVGVPLPR